MLLTLRSRSESGGRVEMGQNQIAALLDLSRPSATSGLRELILARLVTKQRNGVYRINAMLAGYESPAAAQRAIDDMPVEDRLDDPEFVTRYHQAVEDYREQLALERRKKLHVA
ncbi:MarR family transcriptional regulator [Streptomyces sp. NPDC052069]|uniref:MarR family transcriptional regulator n=1 Tax=unclassified Streptomyces TaxID=2593676 RepID=UPI0034420D64